jgi:hypothetical protein
VKPIAIVLVVSVALLLATAACASRSPTDPVEVMRALFDQVNRGRAKAATGLFAEGAQIITGFGQPKGQAKILFFFEKTVVPLKTILKVEDLSADGENVVGLFTLQSISPQFKSPVPMQVVAIVRDGKIQSMTWSSRK